MFENASAEWRAALAKVCSDTLFDAPLAKLTSMEVGGPADALVRPRSEESVAAVWEVAKQYSVPLLVLGGGTNVIVSDSGIRGIVLELSKGFNYLREHPNSDGSALWEIGAGCGTGRVVRLAAQRGLAGAEVLSGVPGSMGGALIMNAGGHEGEIKSMVHRVRALVEGEGVWLSREQAQFSYRQSNFPKSAILLGGEFVLQPGDKASLEAQVKKSQTRRRQTQPLTFPNAGSIFKNPPGDFAGRLIEAAGCKGWREGGAEVSELHANFIINRDNATASDIWRLAKRVQDRVKAHAGVALQLEVKPLGDFSACG